jgi:hypothetical protein
MVPEGWNPWANYTLTIFTDNNHGWQVSIYVFLPCGLFFPFEAKRAQDVERSPWQVMDS